MNKENRFKKNPLTITMTSMDKNICIYTLGETSIHLVGLKTPSTGNACLVMST